MWRPLVVKPKQSKRTPLLHPVALQVGFSGGQHGAGLGHEGCLLEIKPVEMRRTMQDYIEENVKLPNRPNKASVNPTGKFWSINGHLGDLYWT